MKLVLIFESNVRRRTSPPRLSQRPGSCKGKAMYHFQVFLFDFHQGDYIYKKKKIQSIPISLQGVNLQILGTVANECGCMCIMYSHLQKKKIYRGLIYNLEINVGYINDRYSSLEGEGVSCDSGPQRRYDCQFTCYIHNGLGLWCFTPRLTIFQLYRGGQFYQWREKNGVPGENHRPVASH